MQKQDFLGQKMIVLPNSIQKKLVNNRVTQFFFITDIGFFPNAQGHFRKRKNGAQEYVFIYCIEGSGFIEIDGKSSLMVPNSFCILPINVAHSYGANKNNPWSIYWMHFKGSSCESLYKRFTSNKKITKSTPFKSSRIATFNQIYQILQNEYTHTKLEYANIMGLNFISSFIYTEVKQERSFQTENHINLIESVKIFLNENLEKSLKSEDIAKHFNYSPSYLFNLFKKRTGYSLIHFYNLKKIQKACELLKYTDLSIKEISYKMGHYDPLYFSRMFKKFMAVSPRDYRQQNGRS